jgi:cysteine desulfurase
MPTLSPIYLDYMASTPIDLEVWAVMQPYYHDPIWCANPASFHHAMGQAAMKVVEEAREKIAAAIGADVSEVVFTSGATESNNLAIFGASRFYQRQGRHLITLATEHKAVLNVFEQLMREGFSVTFLKPKANGLIDLEQLAGAIQKDTILVSIMHVNNEIGVIQDIAVIASMLKAKGILFHVDAAQGFGPLGIDLKQVPVDLMSFSGHKIYGPKGIGALFVRKRPRVNLCPILFGGSQEQGLRPGTLPTPLIVGLAKAFELANQHRVTEQARLLGFRERIHRVVHKIDGITWNGDMHHRIAANLNFSIHGVDGSDLISRLYPLIVSSQSACSMALGASSHVLQALGVDDYLARASIRLSLGRMTKSSEIEQTCDILQTQIPLLRLT